MCLFDALKIIKVDTCAYPNEEGDRLGDAWWKTIAKAKYKSLGNYSMM